MKDVKEAERLVIVLTALDRGLFFVGVCILAGRSIGTDGKVRLDKAIADAEEIWQKVHGYVAARRT